jgi:cytochrome c oxidase assembly protein subunit 15
MIVVGGLTRLTDSGLSITKWDLFNGILPPLTSTKWQKLFSLYKEIPEYQLLNFSMTLSDFKFIFWWEYAHRLLGRLIGLFFIIPLAYFTLKKQLSLKSAFLLYLIFVLICLQGFIGWYMVQSGLTENTDVNHYRLSLHLTLAFIIFVLTFWNYLKYSTKKFIIRKKIPFKMPSVFLFLLLTQISMGALVSGLDAANIYQTWPLMGNKYFPNDSTLSDLLTLKLFETPSLVQFLHRNIAYFLLLFFAFIAVLVYSNKDFFSFRKLIFLIFTFLLIQIFLGILTIVTGGYIYIASLHQLGSVFLVTTSLILVFQNSKVN